MAQTVLVLGATGGIGGEVARQLHDAGWQVRGLRRHAGASSGESSGDGIEWIQGDAMNRADVERAAQGASVIVHAVNPPGYKRWAELVLPGTVYNFGPDAFPLIDENSPQHPVTKKGAIRVEMEARLKRASEAGARVLIVRAGDFFGPKAGNNWFSQGLVKPGQPVKKIASPAAQGVGHEWSYLPDVARTMVELLARRDTLSAFESFDMGGHWDDDGTKMATAIQRVVERRTGRAPSISAFPWWLMTIASPFNTTLRELREMRYLWQTPVRMNNAKLVSTLGYEPHTPLDEAIEATLVGLRCV